MTSYHEQLQAEREQSALNRALAASPAALKEITRADEKAQAAAAAAEALRDQQAGAVANIEILLYQRADLFKARRVTAQIQESVSTLEARTLEAIGELVKARVSGDSFAMTRFSNGADEIARLAALAPHLPAYIANLDAQFRKIEGEIAAIAEANQVNVVALVNAIRAEVTANKTDARYESVLAGHWNWPPAQN